MVAFVAESRDGITWSKYKGNPLLGPGPQPWDSTIVANAYVTYSSAEYSMWYTSGTKLWELQIGYATSPDGIRWTKADSSFNPVLAKGSAGSWTCGGVAAASVTGPDSAGDYKMWFAGEREQYIAKIGIATGIGATSWTHLAQPVFDAGEPGSWDDLGVCFPRVIFHDKMYEMWYTGFRAMTDRRVGYATSSDGIHWQRSPENPVLVPGPRGSWDAGLTIHPEILFDGKMYHMWYSGNNHCSIGLLCFASHFKKLSDKYCRAK